jgi:hypothetical protein
MVTFMRSGRHVDIILLSHDDRLRPKLDAFMRDHKRQLRANWGEGFAVIAGLLALMLALWVILEALNGFWTDAAAHLASSLTVGRAQ